MSVSERRGLPGAALDSTEIFATSAIDASLAALLNLPPRVIALFGLTVGWPANGDTSEIRPRLPHSSPESLGGRDKLRRILEQRGFGMK